MLTAEEEQQLAKQLKTDQDQRRPPSGDGAFAFCGAHSARLGNGYGLSQADLIQEALASGESR